MKKKIFTICLLLFSLSICQAQGFEVLSATVDIYLHKDGYFDVEENYKVNFSVPKHGIYRDIITRYKYQDENGVESKRSIYISNIEIPGHNYSASAKFVQEITGSINLKLGDKRIKVTGEEDYLIKYRVYNALIENKENLQFYWNIKSSEWIANFKELEYRIHLPEGVTTSETNCFTYSGSYGNDQLSDDFTYDYAGSTYIGKSIPGFISFPGESLTVLINMPATAFSKKLLNSPPAKNLSWILILAGILAVFALSWLIWGKDHKTVTTTAYYPPDGIDSAMAGYLISDKFKVAQVISLIPKWGAEGYIRMEERNIGTWKDTKIYRLKDLPGTAPAYEKTTFDGLFNIIGLSLGSINKALTDFGYGDLTSLIADSLPLNSVSMSTLRGSFSSTLNQAKNELKKEALKFYDIRSEKVKIISTIMGIIMAMGLSTLLLYHYGIVAGISALLLSIFIIVMSFYMRRKNLKGTEIFSELKGFYNFLQVAEVNRLRLLLTGDPFYFEKTMSYAVAFGMLDKWAAVFEELNAPVPGWYSDTAGINTAMGIGSFANSFSQQMKTMSSNMVSSPGGSSSGGSTSSGSFSGGGFSGGGFGGGGGGSW